jgi:hypothetical protein
MTVRGLAQWLLILFAIGFVIIGVSHGCLEAVHAITAAAGF